MGTQGARRLLTFRLDTEQRQRLRARLTREGRTMSEVVTHGLRQYVQRHHVPSVLSVRVGSVGSAARGQAGAARPGGRAAARAAFFRAQ